MNTNEIRPLTREEQLVWLIEFLTQQKEELEKELEAAKTELKLVRTRR